MKNREQAKDWLSRVVRESKNPNARRLAKHALAEWDRLLVSWRVRDVKTQRSLWDFLAGVLEVHQSIHHHAVMTEVISGDDKFYFPVFEEAVARRAKDSKGTGAVATGVAVRTLRRPQTKKWGNVVCKT